MNLIQKILWRIRHIYSKTREKIIVPPYTEKREIILQYKNDYRLNTFIETGTFLGDTIDQFKNDFKTLISFELSKDLAERAAARFKSDPHISIVNGDSGKLLSQYISGISEPCLFWLDGHYSSEFFVGQEYIVTAKGEKNTPIEEELKAVFNHPVKQHVILIDDARCFNGKHDYPSLADLKKIILTLQPTARMQVKRDIIRITPSK